ncbi:TldD/PmbA family protein [Candidatus Latescibacterota bacterium]
MFENILEIASKSSDAAEVYIERITETEVSFEAGSLKSIERKQIAAAGLRIILNGRLGFSASTDPSRADDLVASAAASARFSKEVSFSFPGTAPECTVETFDPAIESFAPETAVDEGFRTIEILKERCPKGLTDITFSASVSDIRIMNTAGLDASYRSTDFSHVVTSLIIEGDSILWVSDGGHFGTLDIRTDAYIGKIADLAAKASRKAPKVSGRLPVIFTAEELPNLLQTFELGVNGRRLLKGDSPLIGREGERVLGEVTMVDDPFRHLAPGSYPFDDEGMPGRRTVLFEGGVFRSFLFDLDTGAKTGHSSTGSASRGALSLPEIDTSNLVMSPGNTTLEDMIANMDEGIIVYGVLGGGQSNLLAGDFALNVMLGFLIKNGEYAGRLIDTMISGNAYEAFGAVHAMGAEVKQVGSDFVPDVCFGELSVSSR